MKDKRH